MAAIAESLKDLGASSFNDLFEGAWPTLRKIYEATGEEMARLRTYEQLQQMVTTGHVDKAGKSYSLSKSGEELIADVSEVLLGPGDVITGSRGKTYDSLTLDDFNKSMLTLHRAQRIVFEDGKGYRRIFKEREPRQTGDES